MNFLRTINAPRLMISGLSGGSGKTLLALGLTRFFVNTGYKVQPFKKGPDYIDAAWLSLAANAKATNLDPFFLSATRLQSLFAHSFAKADYAIIEGNRGLFDGRDIDGTCSTAALAEILNCPVIVAIDCTKMTRTAAAIVLGLANFAPKMHFGGVILNNIGTARHESIVRRSIEAYTDIPVLGALPRLAENPVPERHMGLSGPAFFNICPTTGQQVPDKANASLNLLANFISENVNTNSILNLANNAKAIENAEPFWPTPPAAETQINVENITSSKSKPITTKHNKEKIKLGFVYDAALWFYYAENLEALERAGAELIELSLFDKKAWPKINGLYLGGGFPEDMAAFLAKSAHLARIKDFSDNNMPIYAECGGFMVLANELECHGNVYAMSGVFPLRTVFHKKPQGLGYIEAKVITKNPFHPLGQTLRGHEFHFSSCCATENASLNHTLALNNGTGMGNGLDGLLSKNTYAGYTHFFAPAVPHWAENFVNLCLQHTA